MKNLQQSLTGRKSPFSVNCLKSPAGADPIIKRREKVKSFQPYTTFIALYFFLFLSCIAFPLILILPPVPFPVPAQVIPQWQKIKPGIEYFNGRITMPRLQFWALKVDLNEPDVQIVVSDTAKSTTVSGFVRRYNLVAGINTNPFYPVSVTEDESRKIIGITVADGDVLSSSHSSFDALVFYTDGRAAIVHQADITDFSAIQHAVGGFYTVLQGDIVASRTAFRHPRSGAGVSADGQTLFLVVIDGRRPGSVGATEAELGIILQQLGAADGLNFDGGGSSALVLRQPDGTVRPVNVPIHNGIMGRERAVASCLGITDSIRY
jgi:hypothetical protein